MIDAAKRRARDEARAVRSGVDMGVTSAAIVDGLDAWEGLAGDPTVLVYLALPDEPDVVPLAGGGAVVTRTNDDGTLSIHALDSPRERHPLGFEQPVPGTPSVDPRTVDVALVPGLAFDGEGTRLGRGAGYYDRLLAQLRPDALIVGVAPAATVVSRLPSEAHDVAMTHLATESGVRAVGRFALVKNLTTKAEQWIEGDPDPDTRAELRAVLDLGDAAELESRMGGSLEFGTAGIRGIVGAGSARMNRAVVIRTTAGLAAYLQARGRGDGPVALGYDGRTFSRQFAADTAGVLTAAGIPVRYFEGTAPTPLVSYAAKELGAAAAVVVTASHNPAADNGYKVYDANSAQIIPPVDGEIAAAIGAVGPAVDVPNLAGALDGASSLAAPLHGFEERYLAAVLEFRGPPPLGRSPRIAYTAMHGVGGNLALQTLRAGGHDSVTPVAEQHEPDGRFPTVAFPNPEEPGAMDMVEALGSERDADLALANDPDADRLAVSVPTDAGWRRLSGNEIGVLLADFVLRRTGQGQGDLVINSIVSSPMLGAIAAAHGARWEQTLTGFKWIANAALDLEKDGLRFVFGFEEALGFTVGPVVRDKDGMSAALWFADLVAAEADRGRTALDRLRDLWEEHGLWMSAQHSVRREGSAGAMEIAAAMGRLRTATPEVVAGKRVAAVTDFATGATDRPRWLAVTNLVVLDLEGGGRVLARPSGTEPKLKCYADVRGSGDPDAVAAEASALARGLAQELGLG